MTHPLSGCLLGTAAGDAYGLPYEGLSPRRIGKCFVPRRYALIPLLHGGMVSDDTEHAVMAAQAWIDGAGDPEIFRRSLRGRLKWWFARLPAGIGLATLRSCLKMWLGLGRAGVYSAGNGPAMRAPVLGVLCDDLDELHRLVKISTELTHTDPKPIAAHLPSPCSRGTKPAIPAGRPKLSPPPYCSKSATTNFQTACKPTPPTPNAALRAICTTPSPPYSKHGRPTATAQPKAWTA